MHLNWLPILIALLAIGAMIARPFGLAEWIWACLGALAELVARAVGPLPAVHAVLAGANVYAFLVGMLLLANTARTQGVFEWLAGRADGLAAGSRARLLIIVYGCGVVVTALLSNDTAIIALTPAALALARRTGGSALPPLFACALVASAASFLLPTGNPANLLLYGHAMPSLLVWLGTFGLAAVVAIALTLLGLLLLFRAELALPLQPIASRVCSTPHIRRTLWMLGAAAIGLILTSAVGLPLGGTALIFGIATATIAWLGDHSIAGDIARKTPWSIVPLVAALFVIVAALDGAGLVGSAHEALTAVAHLPAPFARLVAGWGIALVANATNNLPAAVFTAQAVGTVHSLTSTATVAIDLGPNLSVSGSLATMLWLIIVRREGVEISAKQFFFYGGATLVPALTAALLLVR